MIKMLQRNSGSKLWTASLKRYAKDQARSDEGADVLVTAIILVPLIVAAIGLALDVTKNAYLTNTYDAMAQAAVNTASNERNIRGELVASSGHAFVREYSRQRGSDTSHITRSGVQTAETDAFRSDRCSSTTSANIDGISGNRAVSFPYIQINYSSSRGATGNLGLSQFISQNEQLPNMRGYSPQNSHVMTVRVYDSAGNFFLGVLGNGCQVFNTQVSSIGVLEDRDFAR